MTTDTKDRPSAAELMALVDAYAETAAVNGIRSQWAQMARGKVELALKQLPAPQAQADARDAIRELIAKHSAELEQNEYAYFELAYTRRTGWMAWITDKPLNGGPVINPDRKVLCSGQGDTPEEACSAAVAAAKGE